MCGNRGGQPRLTFSSISYERVGIAARRWLNAAPFFHHGRRGSRRSADTEEEGGSGILSDSEKDDRTRSGTSLAGNDRTAMLV